MSESEQTPPGAGAQGGESPGDAVATPATPQATPAAAPAEAAPPATRSWLPALITAALGVAVCFDLLLRTVALMQTQTPGGFDACRTLFNVGCDAALQSRASWRFGVPAAGWGMAYFAVLFWLAFLARAVGGWFSRRAAAAGVLLCVPGLLVSVVLAGAILTGRSPFCPMCLVVHALNLILAVLIWRTGRFGSGGLGSMLRDAFRWAAGPPGFEPPEARWVVVGLASAALVGIVVFQWGVIQVEHQGGIQAAFDPAQAYAEYDAMPQVDIPVDPDEARMGPENAPAQVVVFSDFECPGCSDFAPDLEEVAAAHPKGMSVVFKHYPLSQDCNPAMLEDMHPGSCTIAAASEAARLQGHFWAYHDLAFENVDGAADSALTAMAEEAGLDVPRFERDRRDPAMMARVKADVDLGNRLGVDATPTAFLNGRMVPGLSKRVLTVLVDRAIRQARGSD